MGKIFKRAGIKLSTLIIAIVVFGVMFSTVGATLLFGVFYERTMFNSAYVSSKQSVSQANGTVSNYISSIKNKLDNLCDEADSCDSLQSLEKVVSTAARLEDDIYCVTIYDTDGNILLTENDSGDIAKKNATDLSFDKSIFSSLKDGYAITQPHVDTLYENKYPWVVTIAKKKYSDLFQKQVFVAVNFEFISIAKYIDKISIGQRGYCYIIDSKGGIVYHPQQQMLFSDIKKENTDEVSEMTDGVHRGEDNIYTVSSLNSCNWKIVGVSFTDEVAQSVKRQIAVGMAVALLFSLIISVTVYFLLSRTVTRPVRRLVSSMQSFEKQAETYKYKADKANVVEFSTLSASFEHMVHMIQSLMEKVHNEEIVLRKTELKALQAQINPHFLYNTLDSIQWMCEQDNSKEAVEMVGALAKLFRISISHGNEFITIRDELRHAESYLIIQSYRYKNQFTYSFDVDESLLEYMCNKITIQPFIENAIYHGLGAAELDQNPLAGIFFQRYLEQKAYQLHEGRIPVQTYGDFHERKETKAFGEVEPCIRGRYAMSNLREIFPDFLAESLDLGIAACGRKIHGFDRPDAILSGVESRTSSPVRISRNEQMESNVRGFYPCGEGAGYAGGITSAAMDGLRVAEAVCKKYCL